MPSRTGLAVIDLGSSSFRLVVFEAGDGWWRRTDEIYEPVRIGQGLMATGRLGEEPMERALATLDVFAHFCRASGLGAEQVDAVATSAIRDAENGEGFLVRAGERFGLPIRVLSREEEAHHGYLAAVNSTTLSEGCVLDLGGGSMQLVRVLARAEQVSGSWRRGTVRMSERFLPPNGPAKRRQLAELREYIAAELAGVAWLADLRAQGGGRLVGIGGTVRNLAAAAQRAAGLPSNGVQGMVIGVEALEDLIERLASLPAAERASVPGIKPALAVSDPQRRPAGLRTGGDGDHCPGRAVSPQGHALSRADGTVVRRRRRRAARPLRGTAASRRGPRALTRPARARHRHRPARRRGPAATDRRGGPRGAALGGGARGRAVRARLPPRAGRPGLAFG